MFKRIPFWLALLAGLTVCVEAQPVYTTAREVFEANIEATGGRAAWENVQAIHATQEVVVEMPQGLLMMETEAWIIFPGYLLARTTQLEGTDGIPDVSSTVYMTPEGGWMENASGRQDLTDLPANMGGNQLKSPKEEIALLGDETAALELLPTEQLKDKPVYVVRVGGEVGSKRYYDAETLLLVATEMGTPMGPVLRHASDYREIDGVRFAYLQEAEVGDLMKQTTVLQSMELNPTLDPAALKKMAEQ